MDQYKPWRDYLENILVAIFLALVVRSFVLTGYKVPTGSMAPTLLPGDFIFAYRLPYGIRLPLSSEKLGVRAPQRGEVVVFSYPEQPRTTYVKRVIGLPGDVIKIESGLVSVNGHPLSLSEQSNEAIQDLPNAADHQVFSENAPEGSRLIVHEKAHQSKKFGPLVIPPGEVFLLGDNRDSSDDSRYWGTVPINKIEGRVVIIWFSLDWSKEVVDPVASSLGSKLPSVRWNRIFTSL